MNKTLDRRLADLEAGSGAGRVKVAYAACSMHDTPDDTCIECYWTPARAARLVGPNDCLIVVEWTEQDMSGNDRTEQE